jgi:hypothetical protein
LFHFFCIFHFCFIQVFSFVHISNRFVCYSRDYHHMMRTSWSHGHATHMQRHQFSEKPSKSGLIGAWHKDDLYLGTSTIGNDKTPTQWILICEREVLGWRHEASCSSISPFQFFREPWKGDYLTNTHTHTKCDKQVLLIWIV